MPKTIYRKVLPLFLVILMLFSILPVAAFAADGPEISIEPTSGVEGEAVSSVPSSDVDISVSPNDGSAPSQPPDSSIPPETQPESQPGPDSGPASSEAVEPESKAEDAEESGDPETLDGIPVEIIGGSRARSISPMASGTLKIHRIEAYRWDFNKGEGAPDMRPWYIMTIDGVLAYCVEPQNPDTTSGGYGTIDYNALSTTQQYAIGYALLYGAQDMSDPLKHMATQTIIWEIALGYMDLSTFTCINKNAYNCTIGYNPAAASHYDAIVAAMRAHREVPSFTRFVQEAAPLHTVPGIPGEYKLDLENTNPNCDLASFNFANSGSVRFVKENQTLHITSTGPLDGSTIYAGYKGASGHTSSLVFWTKGAEQVRATAGTLDPVPAYFRLVTENVGQYKITIIKLETGTNKPLAGAEFEVRHSEKGVVGSYTTDGSGRLTVTVPWQGTYILTEITPPKNHLIDRNPVKDVQISTDKPNATVTFHNEPFSGIQITKVDATTKARIPGVTFRIARQGGAEFTDVTTGPSGIASLPGLEPDVYIVREISCPPGYILDPQERLVEVKSGQVAEITIENSAKPSLEITKVDADTGARLAGATFRVAINGSLDYRDIVSDTDGIARLTGMEPGHYTVTEIVAPDGYLLVEQPQTVEIVAGRVTSITVENTQKPGLQIRKVDEADDKPLAGAAFRIALGGGMGYRDIVSGADGIARLTGMEPGHYTVTEIKAPEGYILHDQPQTVEIRPGQVTTITVPNSKKPTLEILKLDSITKQPLQYATFRIAYKNGEVIGEFTSDEEGRVLLEGIDPGLLVVEEITAPDGYIVANNPQEILLHGGETKTLTFENTPKSPIIIKKIDSVTGEPLAGAKFRVTKMNGELVGEYTSGRYGYVTIPEQAPGWYTVVEILSPDGYKLNDAPINVELKLNGDPGIVEFENTPLPGLAIKKVDAITGEGLAGVEFEVTALDGRKIGTYISEAGGIIRIPAIDESSVIVRETKTIPGYQIDTAEKTVKLEPGKVAEVEFENTPLPGLLLQKIDAVTGLGMEGVEFELVKLSGERIGSYTTDKGGYIFVENLTEKHIVVREIGTLPGYKIDTSEKLIELVPGELNRVEFENYPWPYLVIQKQDENKQPLPGAVFKISTPDGREIGTYKTGEKGRIVLTGVDARTVLVQEIEAPSGFVLDDRVFEVELQWGMTTTITLKNVPLKIEVEVEKRGPVEAIAGQEIRYDFRNIENKSSVPLDDFYWSDILPTDAVRLTEIFTGTWNEDLTYKVLYRTNLKDNWAVLAENLITSVNHQLVCSPQVLGLASNEYVTEFRFEFGTVKPGFKEEKAPYIFCRVLAELPDEYQFVNRTEVGGRYGGKWTYDRDAWVTVVFKNEEPRTLPKTGVWL